MLCWPGFIYFIALVGRLWTSSPVALLSWQWDVNREPAPRTAPVCGSAPSTGCVSRAATNSRLRLTSAVDTTERASKSLPTQWGEELPGCDALRLSAVRTERDFHGIKPAARIHTLTVRVRECGSCERTEKCCSSASTNDIIARGFATQKFSNLEPSGRRASFVFVFAWSVFESPTRSLKPRKRWRARSICRSLWQRRTRWIRLFCIPCGYWIKVNVRGWILR